MSNGGMMAMKPSEMNIEQSIRRKKKLSRAERNRRKRTEHPLKYAPIKCPNCGLIVDEKHVVDLDSTCPVCGKELFTELKKMIDRQNNM